MTKYFRYFKINIKDGKTTLGTKIKPNLKVKKNHRCA